MKQSAGISYNIELLANVLSQGYSKKNGTKGTEVVFVASSINCIISHGNNRRCKTNAT